ncbi:hypothetical protein GCM10007205_14730 [Oxalicibacterium flavum]|uniref:Uncharacterized protein n=1 Tax=Oxalicibacterium flavum TaxID=179467 RepID=A0A8J2XX75_9BURK|nr:hypothetical protein [Oxalicibacterium flavum]GGC06583.1 hypothetical protein GCM10007205_14730 [Oxalicibacterium flavum]
MKHTLLALFAVVALSAHAHDHEHDKDHEKQTIARHQAMADAHTAAAQCLRDGKGEKACHAELAAACKGLALGSRCGMRHSH